MIGLRSLRSSRKSTEPKFWTIGCQRSPCLNTSRRSWHTQKAEPLSHVVSLFEEEQQDMKKPDPSRHRNLQLDSRLTIAAKRRHLSSEPTDENGLRLKYAIIANLWLLAQMRQPGRSIYQDLDRCTFNDFLDTLISPSWSFCLSYEFELRKEAFRLCKEQQYGIQAALWSTIRNTEHRMKHWLQLIAIPNTPSSSGGPELQSLKKRIADLERARSRSLTEVRRNKQASLGAGPSVLALPAPAPRPQGAKRGHRKCRKGQGKGSSSPSGVKNFEYLMTSQSIFGRISTRSTTKKRSVLYISKQDLQSPCRAMQVLSYLCWLRWFETLRRLQMPHVQNPLSFILTLY